MNAVIQNLLKIQALEFAETSDKNSEAQTAELRAQIPPTILGHYDRLVARGKKGVAVVRNQTCTGCYMRQPIGKITVLMRDEDIQLCDSCGRYLYLPSPAEEPAAAAPAPAVAQKAEKAAPKRKRKAAAPAVTA